MCSIVRLTDAAHGVEVSIVPSIGNRAYEMKVHGKNILYFPSADVGEFQKRPRLSRHSFPRALGRPVERAGLLGERQKVRVQHGLGNVRGNMPIHGLLVNSPLWRVTEVAADARSAHVTSRLEFWKYPDLMAQWPFAHEYEMTYSLADGVLEVKTTITNLSTEAMPVVMGFHSFFQIPDIPRDEWVAHYPARIHVIAGEHNIPTGEMRPLDIPNPLPLKGIRSTTASPTWNATPTAARISRSNRAARRWRRSLDPSTPVATIWLPAGPNGQPQEFICFEPLSTIISGVNLAHEGKWIRRCRPCRRAESGPRVSGYGPAESEQSAA